MSTPATPSGDRLNPAPTFDVKVCDQLRQAVEAVLAQFPEVRSVCVSVDYYGALNDADIHKGLWLDRQGAVTAPDAIFGSLFQNLRMLELQFQRAIQLAEALREAVSQLGQEVLDRHHDAQPQRINP